MPVVVTCRCGESYSLKDEFAGRLVRCPRCGESLRAPEAAAAAEGQPPGPPQAGDPAFRRDRFLLRQKHLAISEKYAVWDEEGKPLLFVERPAHLARNLLALLAGLAAGGLAAAVVGLLLHLLFGVPALTAVGAVAGFLAALVPVGLALSVKRHVTFYRDSTKQERLLEILQDRKVQLVRATYTVNSADGELLARLHKNYLYNVIRKRWYCYGPDGSVLCVAKEDSLILSLLRRFLGVFFGILRTNFIILEGTTRNVIGEFNRKFTILDRYVLDVSADRKGCLDRRIALALGVMLDTGERR